MRNVPLVLIRDPLRTVFAMAIVYALGLGAGWLSATALADQPPDPSLFTLNVLAVMLVIAVVLRYIPSTLYRVVFPAAGRAARAMGMNDWEQAVAHHREHFAEVERRAWLERLRTVLFLDTLKYSWRVSALINLAFCQTKQGDIAAAVESYERCLAISPENVIALSALNLINLYTGKPVRAANDVIERYLFDPGEQLRLTWITIGLELGGACCCLNTAGPLLLINAADLSAINTFWFLVALLIVLAGGLRLYRWGARRLFLADLYQGVWYVQKGDYQQALLAFQSQYYVLESNGWMDRFRAVALLSPTTYSLRETALLYQVAPYVQLGDGERVVALTRECLSINPMNIFAHTRLELIEAARAYSRNTSPQEQESA